MVAQRSYLAFSLYLKTSGSQKTSPNTLNLVLYGIVKLFKKKCRYTCGNYCCITLLSIVQKLVAKAILNRVRPAIEQHLPEAQCRFRGGRSTIDMMFVCRQLMDNCKKQQQELHIAFVELVKAFDTVNREIMWQLLSCRKL